MALLIAGLILFIATHSVRLFADGWRTHTIARLGEKPWKGLISILSLAGFALIVIGYGQARLSPEVLWVPPVWSRHLAILIMLVSFIATVAAYVPGNSIKAKLGHPMVAGVKAWALAHLISNGNLADVILFGAFLLWSIVSFSRSRRRDRAHGITYPAGTLSKNAITVVIGTVVWAVFLMGLHLQLIGVSPLPQASVPEAPVISAPVVETPAPATAEPPR